MIKVCIVNKNYPPYRGATGAHAAQLAEYLISTTRYEIEVVTIGDRKIKDQYPRVHVIKPSYSGNNKLRRLYGNTLEGYQLIKKARRLNADFYIVLTDPPLLNYWAARMMKSSRWALWTMDLYPQGFVAGGLAADSSPHVRHYIHTLMEGQPDLLITLGAQQRSAIADIYHQVGGPSISIPIGINDNQKSAEPIRPEWYDRSKITLGYIGNLSEAHDPHRILALIEALHPDSMHFVLSCYGIHADLLKATLANHTLVTILEQVRPDEMGYIDIHVVSLRHNWTHICVPSKALSALEYGRPVLFLGAEDSDTAAYVGEAGWVLPDDQDIAPWLDGITREVIAEKALLTTAVVNVLRQKVRSAWEQIDEFISSTPTDGQNATIK